MKPDAFVVGIVLFSLVMIAGANMIMDMSSNYNVDYEADFLENYTQDFGGYTSSGKRDMAIGEGEEGGNWWDLLTKGVSKFFKVIFTPIGMVTGMIRYSAIKLGVSSLFVDYFTWIITILGIFSIGYLIFRIRSW